MQTTSRYASRTSASLGEDYSFIALRFLICTHVNLHRTVMVVAGAIVTVPQTFVVFLLYPVPGKVVGQLDPKVGFAQSRK